MDVGERYPRSHSIPSVLIVVRIPVLYSIGEEISCLICTTSYMLSQLYGGPCG